MFSACQRTNPSRTRFSTSSSRQTSRLRAWQAKSESLWMFTSSHRLASFATFLAPMNPPAEWRRWTGGANMAWRLDVAERADAVAEEAAGTAAEAPP